MLEVDLESRFTKSDRAQADSRHERKFPKIKSNRPKTSKDSLNVRPAVNIRRLLTIYRFLKVP